MTVEEIAHTLQTELPILGTPRCKGNAEFGVYLSEKVSLKCPFVVTLSTLGLTFQYPVYTANTWHWHLSDWRKDAHRFSGLKSALRYKANAAAANASSHPATTSAAASSTRSPEKSQMAGKASHTPVRLASSAQHIAQICAQYNREHGGENLPASHVAAALHQKASQKCLCCVLCLTDLIGASIHGQYME